MRGQTLSSRPLAKVIRAKNGDYAVPILRICGVIFAGEFLVQSPAGCHCWNSVNEHLLGENSLKVVERRPVAETEANMTPYVSASSRDFVIFAPCACSLMSHTRARFVVAYLRTRC